MYHRSVLLIEIELTFGARGEYNGALASRQLQSGGRTGRMNRCCARTLQAAKTIRGRKLLPPRFHVLAQLSLSARDFADFYFPHTEGKPEKTKEKESEIEVEFEE